MGKQAKITASLIIAGVGAGFFDFAANQTHGIGFWQYVDGIIRAIGELSPGDFITATFGNYVEDFRELFYGRDSYALLSIAGKTAMWSGIVGTAYNMFKKP